MITKREEHFGWIALWGRFYLLLFFQVFVNMLGISLQLLSWMLFIVNVCEFCVYQSSFYRQIEFIKDDIDCSHNDMYRCDSNDCAVNHPNMDWDD